MNYETFAKEYRRLFGLMVRNGLSKQGLYYADEMAKLADSVSPEWVDKVESEEG